MNRIATPLHVQPRRSTRGARAFLVGALVIASLSIASEADAAVIASVRNGTLTVRGGDANERIALRGGGAGRLVVDVGDNGSANFTFRRNLFTKIVVNAGAGADRIRIDESKGVFTSAEVTTLNGQAGNDVVLGGSAQEVLRGGTGADTVDGNAGNDDVGLGAGNDSFVWNFGDGSDEVRGDADTDTVTVNGSVSADAITVSPSATPDHVDVNGGFDITSTENLVVNGLGGNDTLSGGALAGLIQLSLNGNTGDDVLRGSQGGDTINGGDGDDTLDGGAGIDTIDGGAGTDTAINGEIVTNVP